jgi:transcriptional regulator with XRE-family HTH domain
MANRRVLTTTDAREIRRLVAEGSIRLGQGHHNRVTMTELARRLGVAVSTVSKIAKGETYKSAQADGRPASSS